MALTDAQQLAQVDALLADLVDGVQAESITIGEETIPRLRFTDLFDRRERLIARGAIPSVLTDADFLAKLETRITDLTSGDDAVSVTIGEETVRGPSLKVLQHAQTKLEQRSPLVSSSSTGATFHLYEDCVQEPGSSSFPAFEVDFGL